MTRKQINDLINIHEAQRDFAKAYVAKHWYTLEAHNKEQEWTDRYVYHRDIVEKLRNEPADDE